MNRDQQSIFGNTYEGVPTPVVPHVHPYPTRYHGPIWSYPNAGLPYVETPYARAPYAGFGGVGPGQTPAPCPPAKTGFDPVAVLALWICLDNPKEGCMPKAPNPAVVAMLWQAMTAAGIAIPAASQAMTSYWQQAGWNASAMMLARAHSALLRWWHDLGHPIDIAAALRGLQDVLCVNKINIGIHVVPTAPHLAGLGGCGCKGLAGSPDGLGDPMLCASTGSSMLDAAIGAGVGYFAAPTKSDQALWALVGAGASWLGGLVGIVGVGAAGLYLRNK